MSIPHVFVNTGVVAATTPTRRTISSYDLTTGNNPGAVIAQPLLNGRNYDEWAQNLRMALSARKKFAFIDGSIPKPAEDSPDLEDWLANNHLLVKWIKLTIEPKLRTNISHREVAKNLWDHIKHRFTLKNGARLQQLRGSLANCRQMGTSVDDYFGRLTKIWDAMAECLTSKTCRCGKCECDLNTAHEKKKDTIRVHDFLFGLDDETHGAVRSQICAQIPLPNLDTVYQTIMQNETVQQNAKKEAPAVMGFTAQSFFSTTRRNNGPGLAGPCPQSGVLCTACGCHGHTTSVCFRVIGFPEWWGDRPRNRTDPQGTTIMPRNSAPRDNSSQVLGTQPALGENMALTEADHQSLTGFSDAQWQKLCQLFNPTNQTNNVTNTRQSGKTIDTLWILDTGVIHHMTGRLDLLDDLRHVPPVSVKVVAGKNALSSQQGKIRLTSNLEL